MKKICIKPSCEKVIYARSLCRQHYKRAHANGSFTQYPLAPKKPKQNSNEFSLSKAMAEMFSHVEQERTDFAVGYQKPEKYSIGDKVAQPDGYVRVKTDSGWKMEHRAVMETHLGRELAKGENVHHINGVRSDNRLENLELWFSAQPYGQRVEDILRYVVTEHRDQLLHMLSQA